MPVTSLVCVQVFQSQVVNNVVRRNAETGDLL